MDFFDAVTYGFPLAWDEDYGLVVTWNGVATYNVWAIHGSKWTNIDVATIDPDPTVTPVSMDVAAEIANEVLTNAIRGE